MNDQLWALISVCFGAILAAILQRRSQGAADWYAARAAFQEVRRANYAEFISALAAYAHANEVRTYDPAFKPPTVNDPVNEADLPALEALSRVESGRVVYDDPGERVLLR